MRDTGHAGTGHIAIFLLGVWFAARGAAVTGVAEAQTFFVDDFVPQPAYAGQTRAPLATQSPRLIVTTLTTDLFNPFGLQWLPDGRMLVTESVGRMRIVDSNGTLTEPIEGLPPIWAVGFNGLHDLALDPGYAESRYIYFSYAAPPEGSTIPDSEEAFAETARRLVARAQLSEDEARLEDVEVIFEATVRRLAFGPDGKLYMTTQAAQAQRANAQDMSHLGGKVLRINPDGSIPEDNPWVGDDSVHDAVFANGLRDPSGAAFNPGTRELWTVEHGPRGGDEINIVRAGRNYGWPIITYGREYDEAPLGDRLDGDGRHGTAKLLLGAFDRAFVTDVLYGRPDPALDGQRLRDDVVGRASRAS